MYRCLLLSLLCAQLSWAQYPRWLRLPVGHLGRGDATQCYDSQIHRWYDVGDIWSSAYSGCKQSRCVREDGTLYLDRHSCPTLKRPKLLQALKEEKLYCRRASGDRRREFPHCCPSVHCKYYRDGRLTVVPEHLYDRA